MQQIKLKLETLFQHIHKERMQDMPMCNPALQVEAVGFSESGNYYLGVLITPWFMNLMLLPVRSDAFDSMAEGSKQTHFFPSGQYEFINGKEEGLGSFQACSLFSPMFEFQDHKTAVETARLVLDEMMEERNHDTVSTHEKTIEKVWRGEQVMVPQDDGSGLSSMKKDATAITLEQRIEKQMNTPISRRNLLRGDWSNSRGHERGD